MTIDSSSGENGGTGRAAPWAAWRFVSPGYFRAVGLRVIRGRAFDENDKPVWTAPGEPAPPRQVVISERLAKRIFLNMDPVGQHAILWKGQGNMDAEVIGVMSDSRERGLASNAGLTVYLPYGRNVLPGEFVVHTRGNPLALVPTVRAIVTSLDPNLPVAGVRSFEEVVQRSVAPQRFNAILLGIFSGLALLLATTGLYGVLSYSMSRRTSEIGLRVALGRTAAASLVWRSFRGCGRHCSGPCWVRWERGGCRATLQLCSSGSNRSTSSRMRPSRHCCWLRRCWPAICPAAGPCASIPP